MILGFNLILGFFCFWVKGVKINSCFRGYSYEIRVLFWEVGGFIGWVFFFFSVFGLYDYRRDWEGFFCLVGVIFFR